MNNTRALPHLRGAALFLMLCLLLQGGLYLLFSEPCAAWIRAAAERATAQAVEADDDGLLEYHALRASAAGARLFVVGCDSGAVGTAELMNDLLRFFKRCTNIRTLVIDLPEDEVNMLNDYLAGDDYYPGDILIGCAGATFETMELIEAVQELNAHLPPARQFFFRSSALTWTLGGEVGEPILYLADRSLGAKPLGELDDMLKYRGAVVTIDLRYLASDGCPEDSVCLPFAGEAGDVWLVDHTSSGWTKDFYRFVVTNTHGGRLAELADALEAERGDYSLILVGAEAAEPIA